MIARWIASFPHVVGITLVTAAVHASCVLLFCGDWTSPDLSLNGLRETIVLPLPLIGSISTLFGAVGVWAWALSKQSTRRGLDDLNSAQEKLNRVESALERNRSDVSVNDVGSVDRLLMACAKFGSDLLEITEGWEPTEKNKGRILEQTAEYADVTSEGVAQLSGMNSNPKWRAMFRDIGYVNVPVRDGLTHIRNGVVFRNATTTMFKDVGRGLAITMTLAMFAAILLIIEDQLSTENRNWTHWMLIDLAFFAWITAVHAIGRPILNLWSLWQRELDAIRQTQERTDSNVVELKEKYGL